uniref:Integrase_H2C2 domain-containing protein n=1 Tax=Heterorhabditis bacteriophora TaxID=37862 RepID=A0A1I7WFS5_HETBA
MSRLVTNYNHIKHGHSGKQHLITVLAQKYWIPRISRLVSNVVKTCVQCIWQLDHNHKRG